MRWLFAMLIAVFCWTGSVSGQQLCVASPKPTPSALSSLPLLAEPALSPMIMCIGRRPKRAAKPRQVAAAAAQSALFPRFAARVLSDGAGLYPGRRAGLPNSFPPPGHPGPQPACPGRLDAGRLQATEPAGRLERKQHAVPWHADLPPMTGVAPLRNLKATPFHRYQHSGSPRAFSPRPLRR